MGDVWTTPTIGSAMRAGESLPMGEGDPGDPLGFVGSISQGWKLGRAAPDWGFNQRNYEEQIAFDLYKPLLEKGYVTRPMDDSLVGRISRTFRSRQDPFWDALAKARADGVTLPHEGVIDAASMTAEALRLRRTDMGAASDRLANGSTAGALTGELLAGIVDPINLIPIGGSGARATSLARSILTTGRNAALANMGLGVVIEPAVRDDAAALGMDRTFTHTATDLAIMGAAGFALGGLAGGVEHALGGRARATPIDDPTLRDDFDRLVSPERQTGEERAAGSVLDAATAETRSSPFVEGPAGDDAHAERMIRARDWAFGVRIPPPDPVRRVSPAEIAGGVTANLRHSERARYKARVRQAESGGNDLAPATTSTAYGRYQPIKSTWLNWYKQRYAASGLTDAQILSKRADGALQEVFMEDFTAANAAMLRRAGFAETADNLYLAHFLGASDAIKVLRADGGAAIEGLVRGRSIRANRSILSGKTAAEVRAWAARKMGGEVSEGAPVRVVEGGAEGVPAIGDDAPLTGRRAESDPWGRMSDELPPEGWLDDADMPRLKPELFSTAEAHARTQIAMEADMDAWEGFDIVDRWTSADEAASGQAVGDRREPSARKLDLIQYIASRGGLIPEGVAADAARPAGARYGHDLNGMFDGNPLIPGMGRLLREKGLTLDEARELAVEAGYFGDPNRTDVTVADLLDALDRQHRGQERLFAGADAQEMEARRARIQADDQYQEFVDRLGEAASARGLDDLGEDDALRAFELWDGTSFDRTLDRLIADRLDQASRGAAEEAEAFRWTEPVDYTAPPRVQSPEGAADLSATEMAAWDDPDGAAFDMQMMSIEHDLRAQLAAEQDIRVANDSGEMTPEWEAHLEGVEATARARHPGETVLYHGTAGAWQAENPSGLGMSFWADDPITAARYVGAGGGRRKTGNAGRIVAAPLPREARILDITTDEGLAILAGLPKEGRMSGVIIGDAARGGAEANNSFWTLTKRAAASDAQGIRDHIVGPLRQAGYDGIRFRDDSHAAVAIFDDVRMDMPEPSMLTYALDDGAEPRSLADIMAEIDEEEAAIAAIEACL